MSLFFTALAITVVTAACGWLGYYYLRRYLFRRNSRRVTRALIQCQQIFSTLEHIPDPLIRRDVRSGVVHLLNHHIQILQSVNSQHPMLTNLRQQMSRINRMPSGMQRVNIRSKSQRQAAIHALEQLAKIMSEAILAGDVKRRVGDLASASARFCAQQLAVENARQSIQDAENLRAYPEALNFAYQAQSLCRSLPPLVGKLLSEAVDTDIERLEKMQNQQVART